MPFLLLSFLTSASPEGPVPAMETMFLSIFRPPEAGITQVIRIRYSPGNSVTAFTRDWPYTGTGRALRR